MKDFKKRIEKLEEKLGTPQPPKPVVLIRFNDYLAGKYRPQSNVVEIVVFSGYCGFCCTELNNSRQNEVI